MVMRPEPWARARWRRSGPPGTRLVVPTPGGRPFTQALAQSWPPSRGWPSPAAATRASTSGWSSGPPTTGPVSEVSLGDYVLAGGESAVLVMVEAVARLLPGVLGNGESRAIDSHADGLLEGPSYTRPPSWRGHEVPAVLQSGDHAAIARWRRERGAAPHRRPAARPAGRAARPRR